MLVNRTYPMIYERWNRNPVFNYLPYEEKRHIGRPGGDVYGNILRTGKTKTPWEDITKEFKLAEHCTYYAEMSIFITVKCKCGKLNHISKNFIRNIDVLNRHRPCIEYDEANIKHYSSCSGSNETGCGDEIIQRI